MNFLRRHGLGGSAALIAAICGACHGPHVAPNAPKLGDNRYYAFSAAKARVRGIEAASAEGIAEGFASDAVILDAKTGTVVASGRARIRDLYAAWLAGCPQPRIETVKREYEMRGGVVTDVERVQCGARALGERRVRMEVVNRLIVREEGDWL
jgi:ketosteroid isomerase-like protein